MDCLASTGLPVLTWVVLGVAAVAAGLITWFFLRKTGRRGTAALAVALILAAGGVTLSVVSSSPAQAATFTASCRSESGGGAAGGSGAGGSTSTVTSTVSSTVTSTVTAIPTDTAGPTPTPTIPMQTPIATTAPPSPDPIDLTPTVTADPPIVTATRATQVTYTLSVNNVLTTTTTGPVTVLIEKHPEQGVGATFIGTGWTVDKTSDPANFVATFTPTIPGKSASNFLIVTYPSFSMITGQVFLGSLIKTGSGGDSNATNNYAGASVRAVIALQGDGDSQ